LSYLLFMDESGHDRVVSPREVLAGVAIEDRDLWNVVGAIHEAEIRFFGRRISSGRLEIKGQNLLKRKVFKHAAQLPPVEPEDRQRLAKACLDRGDAHRGDPAGGNPTKPELTALAQAKLAFVEEVLALCARFHVRAFASIVPQSAPRTEGDFLRKDYAYLFERYFYFLEDRGPEVLGLVIFDEKEKSQSHILIDQLTRYFRDTGKGRMRAARVIPEPFFVHSELTTAIQVADLVAYVTAWGVSIGPTSAREAPARAELEELGRRVCELRYRAEREVGADPAFGIWSFAWITDLRPKDEQIGKG
jgi:hypothetical protein